MDAAAGDYAALGGTEIVNAERTIAYLNEGYGPPSLQINAGCSCSSIRSLAGCTPDPYTFPGDITIDSLGKKTKAAPWFDPFVPESADFAGFYPTEFEGMDSTYTRQSFPRIQGGAVLGRQRAQERILTWRGFLFGRTCCAVQFGMRWLTAQLTGINCDCDSEDLDLLVCCPEAVSGITNCQGLPSVQFATPCAADILPNPPGASALGAFRTLKEVALLNGPKILSQRKTGCRGGCTPSTPCAAESCIIEVEFSLIAGNPFFHGCPTTVCSKAKWPVSTGGSCPAGSTIHGTGPPNTTRFKKTTTVDTKTGLLTCPSVNCNPVSDCLKDGDVDPITGLPTCEPPALPVITPTVALCAACDPLDPVSVCCHIRADDFGEFFEGVPVIEIFSGNKVMRNTTVKFFNDPLQRPCSAAEATPGNPILSTDDCNLCDSITIRYIPKDSTLVIDGVNKTITLKCPGNELGEPADALVVSPFSWSILQCFDTCVCVVTDGIFVDTASTNPASVTITIIPRQM